jgi:hypothetical protein
MGCSLLPAHAVSQKRVNDTTQKRLPKGFVSDALSSDGDLLEDMCLPKGPAEGGAVAPATPH